MPSGTESLEDIEKIVPGISHRKMMGEYLLYKDGKLFGGIYDDRLLLKITKATASVEGWPSAFPYDGGGEMILVTRPFDADLLNRVIDDMLKELPAPKKGQRTIRAS